jgi:N-acetylmuramoyl-L-alanine amidase
MYNIQNDLLYSATSSNKLEQVPFYPTPNVGGKITPRFLVIHFTAGAANAVQTAKYFQKPAAKTSAHLILDKDGTWTQNVELSVKAWQAGRSSWAGVKNLNSHSIGIEVCNPGPLTITQGGYKTWWGTKINDPDIIEAPHPNAPNGEVFGWQSFTEAQVNGLIEVGQLIMTHYGLEECVGHDMIAPGRKRDPGPCMNYRVYEQINAAMDNTNNHWEWYVANVKTSLNGRGGPGTNYDIVAELPKGTAIEEILAKEGVWWFIELEEGQQLWLHSKFLGKRKVDNT